MSKRMSMEEKRKVILGIYHETKLVYTEKEILALATKAGVNAGTYVHASTIYSSSVVADNAWDESCLLPCFLLIGSARVFALFDRFSLVDIYSLSHSRFSC